MDRILKGLSMSVTVRVWDLPTRIFHWALVAGVLGLVTTGLIGGEAMAWHFRCGYSVLVLLLFRVVWGMLGGHWSRFASFIYSPATLVRYLRGQGRPEHTIGHTPLGAISVFALLGFLLMQVATGLVSDDEIANSGPLSRFVSSAIASKATFYHANVGKIIVIALVALHIAAVLFYFFRRNVNLVRPMIGGDKESAIVVTGSRDDGRSRTLAALVFLGCAALVAAMLKFAE